MNETGGSYGTQPWPSDWWHVTGANWAFSTGWSASLWLESHFNMFDLWRLSAQIIDQFPWKSAVTVMMAARVGSHECLVGSLKISANSWSPVLSDGDLHPSSLCRAKHIEEKTCPLRKSGAVSWDTCRVWGDTTGQIWGRPYLWRCERLASNNAETRDYMQCMAKQATMCNKRYWESAHCESTTKPSTIFDAETWKRWNFFLLLHNMPKHLMKSKWCSSMHKYAQVCSSMHIYSEQPSLDNEVLRPKSPGGQLLPWDVGAGVVNFEVQVENMTRVVHKIACICIESFSTAVQGKHDMFLLAHLENERQALLSCEI